MYWRFDTETATRWTPLSGGVPFVDICMDTDNNTTTGFTIGVCGNQPGVDFRIRVFGWNNILAFDHQIVLLRCTTALCVTVVAGASLSVETLAGGAVNEIRARLSDMNITGPSPACPGGAPIPSSLYFDNGEASNDDNVPNAGFLSANVPCPLPVTLTSFTAARGAGGVELAWASSSELNIQGYHVLRSAGDRAAATRITDALIPGTGTGITGGSYSYTDTTAAVGSSYSYWLEVVNSDGTPEEYGPVSYAPGTAQRTSVYLPLVVR